MANGKKRNKKKLIIFSSAGALLLIIILLLAFSGNKEIIVSVQTEKAERKTITQTVSATGKINPEYQVVITPEVTGEIVELPVKEGDKVKKGQLLIRIKSDSYIAQRDRALANLESMKATLKMRDAQLELVKSEYKRVEELYKKNLASEQEMEVAKSNLATNQAQYDAQRAAVLQAEAQLKEASESLYKTAIYSPMDGTISQLNVEVGERVLGSGFSQGTNLMTVADLKQMTAEVQVDENDVVLISIGDTAKIQIDAFGDKKYIGLVYQIGNSAKTTGLGTQEEVVNFAVKIRLLDIEDKIRPGMSCNADIETETKANVISVPIQSVTARALKIENPGQEGDEQAPAVKNGKDKKPKEVVFIVESNTVKMKEVKTGISDDSHIEIIEGLEGGEEIVSGPYRAISRELSEGSKVRLDNKRDSRKKQ